MRRTLKIAAVLVGAVVVLGAALVALAVARAERPPVPVGFEQITVADPGDKPLTVGIWYPSAGAEHLAVLGLSSEWIASGGPVVGHHLPLIVVSHGNAGLFSSHADTALALAASGFVVAAVTHTGDNADDQSYVGTPRWLIDRPRHIPLVLDHMLQHWHAHAQLDPARIGMFGFSAGGFTTLVAIGGTPDYRALAEHCRRQPEFACSLWPSLPHAVPAAAWRHDARIRAAVIAAPGYGFAFAPRGLADVHVPVQLWNGTADTNVPYASNEAVVRRLLPAPTDYHAVPGAGHFAFVAPCLSSWLFPLVCSDAPGFDRAGFHRAFNRSVVAFFRKELQR